MGCYKLHKEEIYTTLKVVYVADFKGVAEEQETKSNVRYIGVDAYAYNNPLKYTDPDGNWVHIVVGAALGGIINVATHWNQISTSANPWQDGFVAFGIGAVAGGIGAATGGAALAASGLVGASVAGGALAGFAGAAVTSPIQGLGNAIYFHDTYTAKNFIQDVAIGTIGGAVIGGTIAGLKGNNVWTGKAVADGRNVFSFKNLPNGNATGGNGTVTFPDGKVYTSKGEYLGNINDESFDLTKAFGEGVDINANSGDGTSLFKHSYKYDPRVRIRGVQDPVSHNFSYRYDDAILATDPIIKNNGYKIFQLEGTMNDKSGVFELGLTKDGIINHRFFRPFK